MILKKLALLIVQRRHTISSSSRQGRGDRSLRCVERPPDSQHILLQMRTHLQCRSRVTHRKSECHDPLSLFHTPGIQHGHGLRNGKIGLPSQRCNPKQIPELKMGHRQPCLVSRLPLPLTWPRDGGQERHEHAQYHNNHPRQHHHWPPMPRLPVDFWHVHRLRMVVDSPPKQRYIHPFANCGTPPEHPRNSPGIPPEHPLKKHREYPRNTQPCPAKQHSPNPASANPNGCMWTRQIRCSDAWPQRSPRGSWVNTDQNGHRMCSAATSLSSPTRPMLS